MNQITKPSILLFIILISAAAVAAQSTAFTYQGKLLDGGAPANGTYEMQFTLWNSAANGTQIGGVVGNSNVNVRDGIFTVPIDFGFIALAIDLQGLKYLEISVRANSADPFTILTPRQLVTSAPYATIASAAQSASIATTATNAGNADNLGGVPASSYLQANGNGSGLSNLNASSLTSGIIPSGRYGIDVASTEHGNEFYGVNIFTEETDIDSISTGGIELQDWGYIKRMRLDNLAADPESPSAENPGTIYFNTAEKAVKVSDGTAWNSIGRAPVQTFSGQGEFPVLCNQPNTLRSVTFTKQSNASRLRIVYRDEAETGDDADGRFWIDLTVKIDGIVIPSLSTRFQGHNEPPIFNPTPHFSVEAPFTAIGYVSGITAGTHTFSSHYEMAVGTVFPTFCHSTINPYLIEIEEVP